MNRRTVLTIGVGLLVGMAWAKSLQAHMAQGGWLYDGNCCSGTDCIEIPKEAVRIVEGRMYVVLTPEIHPRLKGTATFDATDRIKRSKDNSYHACARPLARNSNPQKSNYAKGSDGIWYRLLCLYIPMENG